jgi:hypothetical protein
MSVHRGCNPGNGAVELDVSSGQYLEYRVSMADADVQYVLAQGDDEPLFDSSSHPAPCTCRWPAEGEQPSGHEVRHTLSILFLGDTRLLFEVDRMSPAGAVKEVVKRCTFRSSGGVDEHFETLRVFLS